MAIARVCVCVCVRPSSDERAEGPSSRRTGNSYVDGEELQRRVEVVVGGLGRSDAAHAPPIVEAVGEHDAAGAGPGEPLRRRKVAPSLDEKRRERKIDRRVKEGKKERAKEARLDHQINESIQ